MWHACIAYIPCEIQSVVAIVASFVARVIIPEGIEAAVVALVVVVVAKDLAWVRAVVNMLVEALVIDDVMSNVLSGDKGGVDMFNMLADMGIIVVTAAVMALKFIVPIRFAVDMLSDVVVGVLFDM